ncbi:signal peptidase I [Kitasatospora brasiliensis]|uniref:signal peptidase I n=1 Tax=Kitasatospora brasiliensis TaxID=3058040 RepID=UPI00293196E3|nr:signal peptidase I [Kitasatospora sp. K002]
MGSRGRGRLADPPAVEGVGVGGGVVGSTEEDGAVGTRTEGGGGAGGGVSGRTGRGRAERRRSARRAVRRRKRSLVREVPLIILVALLVALVMKTFLIQVFVIPSGSMEQTIRIGDRVLVDKLTPWFGSEPQRGDVVVFKDPGGWLERDRKPSHDGPVPGAAKQVLTFVGLLPSDNEQDLIKRVIGVGGDSVECCDAQGRLSVNGHPMDEPYLSPGNPPSRQTFKVQVPQGRLWVMGDHRDVSADSRFHMGNPGQGTIPVSDVVGRAFVIAWPLDRFHQLDAPSSLSSLARTPQAGGTWLEPALVGPVPAEPPLVMGVLGILPLVVRRPGQPPE